METKFVWHKDITCGGCKFFKLNKEEYKIHNLNNRNDKLYCEKSGLTIADSCERIDKCKEENWKERDDI